MKPLLEDLREAAAEAARRMDDLGPTIPQHVVDAARSEVRALVLQCFRYLRSLETPEARAEREVTLARSRLRELHCWNGMKYYYQPKTDRSSARVVLGLAPSLTDGARFVLGDELPADTGVELPEGTLVLETTPDSIPDLLAAHNGEFRVMSNPARWREIFLPLLAIFRDAIENANSGRIYLGVE